MGSGGAPPSLRPEKVTGSLLIALTVAPSSCHRKPVELALRLSAATFWVYARPKKVVGPPPPPVAGGGDGKVGGTLQGSPDGGGGGGGGGGGAGAGGDFHAYAGVELTGIAVTVVDAYEEPAAGSALAQI